MSAQMSPVEDLSSKQTLAAAYIFVLSLDILELSFKLLFALLFNLFFD